MGLADDYQEQALVLRQRAAEQATASMRLMDLAKAAYRASSSLGAMADDLERKAKAARGENAEKT